jgi:hypothetical protein
VFGRCVKRPLHGAPVPLAYRRGGVRYETRVEEILARRIGDSTREGSAFGRVVELWACC